MPEQRNVYDAVAYAGHSNVSSHPDRLAAIGLLHGLETPAVATCRVLEIGCSRGNNLIPMAYTLPGAEFLGIDLAGDPIAYGQRKICALGLSNVRLLQADLMDLTKSAENLGLFDYIVVHGVYAWVPEPVRDALLAACQRLLAPNGIAFISYNVLPGGHLRRILREMMLSYLGGVCEDVEAVNRALLYVQFILESMPEGDPVGPLLQRELEQMRKKGPSVVFHDELEAGYGPVLFTSFVAHAGSHGLQYLSDASVPPPTDPGFQPEVAARARAISGGDRIAEEQTLDFVRMRMYRETLLCHAEREISRDVDLNALGRLRLASRVQRAPAAASPSVARVYTLGQGASIESQHPAVILLLDTLAATWPRSLSLAELQPMLLREKLSLDADLLTRILRLFVSRVIELHSWQAPVAAEVGSQPRVSAWFRQSLAEPSGAATLLHTTAHVTDPLLLDLVPLLDGTRDRVALLEALAGLHPGTPPQEIAAGLEPALQFLAREGLLLDDSLA